jgi:hypothetical protein
MPTVTLHTLIYTECPRDESLSSNLVGPKLHKDAASAIGELFKYITARIPHTCSSAFLEWAEDNIAGYAPLENVGEVEQAKHVLSGVTHDDDQKVIVDWYFEFANDDENECFYQLDEFEMEL